MIYAHTQEKMEQEHIKTSKKMLQKIIVKDFYHLERSNFPNVVLPLKIQR